MPRLVISRSCNNYSTKNNLLFAIGFALAIKKLLLGAFLYHGIEIFLTDPEP